jgi:hypothetical protein
MTDPELLVITEFHCTLILLEHTSTPLAASVGVSAATASVSATLTTIATTEEGEINIDIKVFIEQ